MTAQRNLTRGYVQRHIPPGSGLSLGIAVLDIAQDYLLAHLSATGILGDLVVFTGGTALRKLFAGSQGRFSTDIDLAMAETNATREELAEWIAGESRETTGFGRTGQEPSPQLPWSLHAGWPQRLVGTMNRSGC
jgi:predicted nucleotidyltransferase component of viral defense system